MELDLSKLDALTPLAGNFKENESKTPPKDKNAIQGNVEGLQGIAKIKLEREQADNTKTAEVYKQYQQNISRSGQLRTDIIKGVKAGESPYKLLLKAVECISLMTGDSLFLDATRADIKSIYGAGLLEVEPLQVELEEVQTRLVKLEQAATREGEPEDSKQRIGNAIKAHHKRAEQLQGILSAGGK